MPLTLTQMHALFNDNTAGDISAADGRDVIEGLYEQDQGTPPVDGNFSWVNQNSAVLNVNTRGYISVIGPHTAGGNLSCRVKAAPATPYTITARFEFGMYRKDFQSGGLLFREAGTGEIITWGPSHATTQLLAATLWASPTSATSNYLSPALNIQGFPKWLRIADNGTNRIYSMSSDGENFVDILTHSRTTDLTADSVGFFINAQNSATPNVGAQIVLRSWDEA